MAIIVNSIESNMIEADDNNDGTYYLYYPRHFAWEGKGFKTRQDTALFITDLIHKYCKEGTDVETINNLVTDIDDYAII